MKTFIEFYNESNENLMKNTMKPNSDLWNKWKKLVNMTKSELQKFYDSEEGLLAGYLKGPNKQNRIDNSRESAKILLEMIPIGKSYEDASKNWSNEMLKYADKQVISIQKLLANRKTIKGNPFMKDEKRTEWHKSLLIYGHNPLKHATGLI
jgi:hypothetical protein